MSDENIPPQLGQKRPSEESALALPPRKKAGPPDYWRRKGRHVGRTIHCFVNIGRLVLKGMQLDQDLALMPKNEIEKYPATVRQQYDVYRKIIRFLPELEAELAKETITNSQLDAICASIQAGIGNARSDDVKGVKSAVLDWITDPEKGLVPPLKPTSNCGRGFNHEATGKELCPAGLDWNDPSIKDALRNKTMVVASDEWPIFLYLNGDYEPEEPWRGLLRGRLLVNAFKHIFTSPSSVDDEGRSTKASNSVKHAMTEVTAASIVYAATIVRFCLTSHPTLSSTDAVINSQDFYNVLLAFLNHPDEVENLNELLMWWNKQVFPHAVAVYRAPTANSALARLLEARKKRAALREIGRPR